MDTMESTKIVGGLCGAFLILLLVQWGAEIMYHVGSSGHGHGDGEHVSGYPIEVAAVEDNVAGEEGPSLEELLAAADVEKGRKAFSKCKACHSLEDGVNGTGPHLYAIADRAVGSVGGFAYSDALTGLGGNWDAAALDGFIKKPNAYAKGTKMSFNGMKKAKDRANLIAYLQTIQ